jgi:hypothetical protein
VVDDQVELTGFLGDVSRYSSGDVNNDSVDDLLGLGPKGPTIFVSM